MGSRKQALKYAFGDFKKNKTRSFFGVLGISISIFLLTSVSILTDTVSSTFADYMVSDAGNLDLTVTPRKMPYDPKNWTNYFDPKDTISNIRGNMSNVDIILKRWIENTNFTRPFDIEEEKTQYLGSIFGYESYREDNELGFGYFENEPGYPAYDFTQGIPVNQCVISPRMATFLGVKPISDPNEDANHQFTLSIGNVTANLTVCAVATPVAKVEGGVWSRFLIMVDVETVWQWMGDDYRDMYNSLGLTFLDSKSYYDIRNIEESQAKVIEQAEILQEAIGWEYTIRTPKGNILGLSEYMSVALSIIFVFIMIIAMLIAGILILGILSTSVEERIREFGIFRTLGARRSYNLQIIIYQGLILSIVGSSAGIFTSIAAIQYIAIPYIQSLLPTGFLAGQIAMTVTPTAVLSSYGIGIGVSMVVSIAPALQVARMKIVESINPYRHEETLYKVTKESAVNVKLIIFGTVLAVNGGIIYFAIPELLVTMNFGAFAILLIVILMVFLIGLTLAGLGLMPLIQRAVVGMFAPFFKKVINIVKITIHRYQRRNTSTIIMFSISFSFIIFTTGMVDIQQAQISALQMFNTGSHIVVYSEENVANAPTTEIKNDLLSIDGVERVSSVLASTDVLSGIYAGAEKDFDADLGDYINYQSTSVTLAPVDENYMDTVFSSYITFTGGDLNTSMAQLFNGNDTCIISEAIAEMMAISMGDTVRLTFYRGEEVEIIAFQVVGISSAMSGFWHFKSQAMNARRGGVMISHENYRKYMELPEPAYVDRVFVKLRDEYIQNYTKLTQVQSEIQDKIGAKYGIYVRNVIRNVKNQEDTFQTVSVVFEAILAFTVVICLFGLLSSAYSTILERKREIGIIRTLGLNSSGVGALFTIENLIILLSSAITGSIIGYFAAWLMSENLVLFTESPRLLAVPWETILRIYAIAAVFLLVGMQFLLRKVKHQNLITIFRETL